MSSQSGAIISKCGKYRYQLSRMVSESLPGKAVFILLNPSTADAEKDDPTVRRCVGFTKRLGYGLLEVVNLYAYRTTDPVELACVSDPVGPWNNQAIEIAVMSAGLVVCGWGHLGRRGRDSEVLEIVRRYKPCHCLGLTQQGFPRHPLYLRKDSALIPFGK